MNRIKPTAYTFVLAGLLFLQSCKKVENQEELINTNTNTDDNVKTEITAITNQDFTSITWGTAAGQPLGTHEVHGEVVHEKLYIFGGYDINKRPQWTPTKRAYVYDPINNSWTSITSLPHEPSGSNFGGVTHVGL